MGVWGERIQNDYNTGYHKPSGGCLAVIIPRFVRRQLPAMPLSEANLHPSVKELAKSLLSLRNTESHHAAPSGSELHVIFRDARRVDHDFETMITLEIDRIQVFDGSFKIEAAFRRGLVTFAHRS